MEVILDLLGSGMSMGEILEDHPELEKEDIWASLEYAKLLVSVHFLKLPLHEDTVRCSYSLSTG